MGSGFRIRQEILWTNLIQELNRRACTSSFSPNPNDFGSRRKFNKNINNLFKPIDRQQATEFNLNQAPNNLFATEAENMFDDSLFSKLK
jgi:hypothetical protein